MHRVAARRATFVAAASSTWGEWIVCATSAGLTSHRLARGDSNSNAEPGASTASWFRSFSAESDSTRKESSPALFAGRPASPGPATVLEGQASTDGAPGSASYEQDLVDILEGQMQAMLLREAELQARQPVRRGKRGKPAAAAETPASSCPSTNGKLEQGAEVEAGAVSPAYDELRSSVNSEPSMDGSSGAPGPGEVSSEQQQQASTSTGPGAASSQEGSQQEGPCDSYKQSSTQRGPGEADPMAASLEFWQGLGVIEPATLGALSRLTRKHTFLADPKLLQDRVAHLQDVLPAGMEATALIRRAPRVMTIHPTTLRRQLQYIASLLQGQDIGDLLQRAPFIASSDMDTVMQNIQELGRALQELNTFDLLCKEPRLLCADMAGQVTPSIEEIRDILSLGMDGPDSENQVALASREAILAHPRLLLVRDDILRARWSILKHAAATNEHWQRDMRRIQRDPAALALLLSRNRQTMQRLDFLVQRSLGQDLSLRMVLTMDTSLFKCNFEEFQAWLETARKQHYQKLPLAEHMADPPPRTSGLHHL